MRHRPGAQRIPFVRAHAPLPSLRAAFVPWPQTMTDPTTYTPVSYFETQERPASLEGELVKVRAFVLRMKEMGKRIVLVTVSTQPACFLRRTGQN